MHSQPGAGPGPASLLLGRLKAESCDTSPVLSCCQHHFCPIVFTQTPFICAPTFIHYLSPSFHTKCLQGLPLSQMRKLRLRNTKGLVYICLFLPHCP